jgi:uncharacterized protein YjiS (DUF1127 family)
MPMGSMAGSAASLKDMAMRLYPRMMRAYRCHKAERELLQASDDLLAALGVSRADVTAIVHRVIGRSCTVSCRTDQAQDATVT